MRNFLVFLGIAIGFSLQSHAETLDGHWVTDCYSGKISEMRINGAHSYLREAFYKESNCKTLLFFLETYGLVQYPERDADLKPDLWPVDYTYQAIHLTPLTEEMAQQFNQGKLCGLNDWMTLVPQLISGLLCRLVDGARPITIPIPNQQRFGIFKITEPWLYFGHNNQLEDSSSPARRPKDLQPDPFGKRR